MTAASFRYAPNADTCGTHLIDRIPQFVWDRLVENFPASGNGFWDPSGGYEGDDRTFCDKKGRVFNVYTRWGVPRVGGLKLKPADIKKFEDWAMNLPVRQ